ncbi:MAG TPA: PRC-barrel domain-containing protein [Opitutales bacterium]|jgi:sporulation protein YlmC with PRC-barrel domain|nr:PRC-barrel domain-containing protein [Opitutales bacterium]
MQNHLSLLIGGLFALALPLPAHAQETPTPIPVQGEFGPKTKWNDITEIQVTNLDGDSLGRVQDLTLDLTNGRVVEVLIVSGQTFRLGGKTVAVPPNALIPNENGKVYQINMSLETWNAAPAFDLSKWAESTQTDQVAAAYHYFREEPNFLITGEAVGRTSDAGRPITALGAVERMSKILNMPVENLKGDSFGKLQSFVLDVPNGRIINTFINAGGFGTPLNYSTVIPPTLLSFNEKRTGLVLDVSKVAYDKEPSVIFQNGGSGEVVGYREQAAVGPHTDVALVQGTNFEDINATAEIYKSIRANKLDIWKVEVATRAGRVTLRGNVNNQGTKESIGALAIAVVKLENVDNQIQVMAPILPKS